MDKVVVRISLGIQKFQDLGLQTKTPSMEPLLFAIISYQGAVSKLDCAESPREMRREGSSAIGQLENDQPLFLIIVIAWVFIGALPRDSPAAYYTLYSSLKIYLSAILAAH
jgi:hypothetical protein